MLQVKNLFKQFDSVKAVNGVSFDVFAGECVALIGPNGAGKSTCFSCVAGQYRPTSGVVLWNGQSLNGLDPSARLRQGVARTFQVAQVFEALTVLQNVQLAIQASLGMKAISVVKKLAAQSLGDAFELLEKTGLSGLAGQDALSLPYGAKKRLELAVALAADPGLLLLDEPVAGLEGHERADLMRLVKSLAVNGMAVLYTEHNMDAVSSFADRVLVLIEGSIAAQGSFEDISRDATVRRRYLGGMPSEGTAHA
jgi:branched-chain amino acid transport system ATP-binding protein